MQIDGGIETYGRYTWIKEWYSVHGSVSPGSLSAQRIFSYGVHAVSSMSLVRTRAFGE
jgi:hypothetical protein